MEVLKFILIALFVESSCSLDHLFLCIFLMSFWKSVGLRVPSMGCRAFYLDCGLVA